MPGFVIHWHAYFPTGLFYLLPGPCLPCPKFDVSGYQFIPTWNKEKFMVRDKQHHSHQKPHLNTRAPCTSGLLSYMYFTFLCNQSPSISHCSSVFLSHLFLLPSPFFPLHLPVFLIVHQYLSSIFPRATGTVQSTTSSVSAYPSPAALYRQRGTSLASSSAQHDLSLESSHPEADTRSGLLQVFFVPLEPCGEERLLLRRSCATWACANHPDVPAPLQVLILQGQQNLSFLPERLLQRWKSLSQSSRLSINNLQEWLPCSADAPVGAGPINTVVCYSELCFSWKCEILPSL